MKEVYLAPNFQSFSLKAEAKSQNLRVWHLGRSQEVEVQYPGQGPKSNKLKVSPPSQNSRFMYSLRSRSQALSFSSLFLFSL